MSEAKSEQKPQKPWILLALLLVVLGVGLLWLGRSGEAPEPKTAEPKAPEPKAAEPKAAEPKAAEPKTAEPKTAEPKADSPAKKSASKMDAVDDELFEEFSKKDKLDAGTPEPSEASQEGAVEPGDGVISGVVLFEGKAPKESPIRNRSDVGCDPLLGPSPLTQTFALKNGHLKDVFVYVANPPATESVPGTKPVILDQKDCRYRPSVFGILAKQPLEIINSDPLLHNVHGFGRPEFSIGMPTQGQRIRKNFKRPLKPDKNGSLSPIDIGCDVHPWMHAHAFVMSHPYFAVTDENGSFVISGLSAGGYELRLWHTRLPSISKMSKVVSVRQDQETPVEIVLQGEAQPAD